MKNIITHSIKSLLNMDTYFTPSLSPTLIKGVDDVTKSNIKLISGNSHPELADAVSNYLRIPLTETTIDSFANTEIRVEIHENIRGDDVYIIQTGTATETQTINDVIMETMLLIDTCRRSHAKTITLIMPNYPYARADKKDRPRVPISAKIIADMFETAGVTRLIAFDLHAAQIQGYYSIPVDNIFSINIFIEYFKKTYFKDLSPSQINTNYILVSPDNGGVRRVMAYASKLKMQVAIMHKQRNYTEKSLVEKTVLIAEDEAITNKTCIVLDDMADTFGTMVKSAETLKAFGAKDVIVAVTHGILSEPAIERLERATIIKECVVTDSVPPKRSPKIKVISSAPLLAEVINRICHKGSISELF